MEDKKITTTEYDEKDFSEQVTYNRKNVNIIKKMILCMLAVACVIPVLFCAYLIAKVSNMQEEITRLEEELSLKQQMVGELSSEDALSNEDLALLDQEAVDDINKDTSSPNEYLSASDDSNQGVSTGSVSGDFNSNGKKVYLTFDDGPSIYTDEILDILAEHNVKATFFVVYNDDQDLWDEYSRIVEEGHTLGMHSYSHMYDVMYVDMDSYINDVSAIHDFLYEQTGVDCTYYRFPGGSSNTVSRVDMQDMIAYLNQEGYTYYDWNSLSGDAVDASLSPEELNANIMTYVRANEGDSIVLMHDLKNAYATVEGLEELIDTLISEGYEICPITEDTVPVQHVSYESEE